MNLMIKSSRLYDALKFIAMIALPGVGTLYFTVAHIWGLPNSGQVVGTITAVDAFLGLFLKQSNIAYNNSDAKFDGTIEVNEHTGTAALSSEDINSIVDAGKGEATFKVHKVKHTPAAKKVAKRARKAAGDEVS